jgi:hypothetical protein
MIYDMICFGGRMQTDGWIELAEYRVQSYFNQLRPSGYNIRTVPDLTLTFLSSAHGMQFFLLPSAKGMSVSL